MAAGLLFCRKSRFAYFALYLCKNQNPKAERPFYEKISMTAKIALLTALILLPLCGSPVNSQEIPVSGGPRELLISYRAQAANRPAFRNYLMKRESARLAALKRKGVLQHYEILFNPFVTPRTWDALLLLSFPHYADTARWKEIERTMPGGLDKAGLALATPSDTIAADLCWQSAAPDADDGKDAVFYVIPYEYNVLDQYKKYIDAYLIPQVTGWIKEGVLARYSIYLNRDPVGPNWDSLFIYQYRNVEAFGRREEITAKVRGPLRNDPAWKSYNDIKQTIRTEGENTIAEKLSGE